MGRKIISVLLIAVLLFFEFGVVAVAREGVFSAYHTILSEYIARHGIVDLDAEFTGVVPIHAGVHYARLIDFDNNEVSELLVVYGVANDMEDIFGLNVSVYGYTGGHAESLFSSWINIAGTGQQDIKIATANDGRKFFIDHRMHRFGEIEFYTVVDGRLVSFLSLRSEEDGNSFIYFISGTPTDEGTFRTAHLTELGITRLEGREHNRNHFISDTHFSEYVMYNNPASVRAVLAELTAGTAGIGNTNGGAAEARRVQHPINHPYTGIPDNYNLVWRVQPTLDYDYIYSCCGMFFTGTDSREVDRTTGQLLNSYYHGGHGLGRSTPRVFDLERNLYGDPGYIVYGVKHGYYGMFPLEEALARFPDSNNMHLVENVDSSMRNDMVHEDWRTGEPVFEWYLTDDAFSGRFAVMSNNRFVTDFIFDGGDSGLFWSSFYTILAHIDDRWGIIDRDGNLAAPFVFDRILRIDDDTMFARYNGRYGILDVRRTAEAMDAALTFPFPQTNLTEVQVQALTETLANLLDGEITSIFQLSNDLFYVIITLNNQVTGGAVVREGRRDGEIIFHVEHHGTEILTEEQLAAFVVRVAATPNILINFGVVAGLETLLQHLDFLRFAIRDIDGTAPNDAALRDIAAFIQHSVVSQSVRQVTARQNQILLTADNVQEAADAAREAFDEFSALLDSHDITLDRPITVIVRIEGQNLNWDEVMQITFDAQLAQALGNNTLVIMLGCDRHALTVSGEALRTIIAALGALNVQIERTGSTYNIVFVDENGNAVNQLPASVGVTLPASSAFNTVFAGFVGGNENWGGQWDELHQTIHFTTPFSGTYEVLENDIEISDISHLPDEVQAAVQFMVSKGFFELDGNMFNSDGYLSRAEFTSTLVRMFFALDSGLATSFTDVPVGSPFYSAIASGEHEELIAGIGYNLFAPERIMTREEAVSVASRTLINRLGFSPPTDPESILMLLTDDGEISYWAREATALAAREGVVDMGGNFTPTRNITRSETALILYRLFMLLFETSPVAIQMAPLADLPYYAENNETPEENSAFPIIPIAIGGAAVIGLGGGITIMYFVMEKKATDDTLPRQD